MQTKKIEKRDEYKKFEYFCLALPVGHRCGYVRIPEGNKFYGKKYTDKLDFNLDVLKGEKIGKRNVIDVFLSNGKDVTMGLLFNVHGGVTYSYAGLITDDGELFGWFIGFDCAHLGDAKDFSIMDDEYKKIEEEHPSFCPGDIIRSLDYVEQECKNLIDQIIKYS